ncbi:hypothetical protein QBC34DRAFT_112336 [Podospora aff. communis PSN243]|uniref:Uncharacterized protein n=1 Tax=Podospora aff. communis PSN243 TaxID=3040156 RepID=A0AAV9GK31_9PEZI|nr:hypothetical protein QBC34DRAFT_112336 [Podospora aff. communis PSN243]
MGGRRRHASPDDERKWQWFTGGFLQARSPCLLPERSQYESNTTRSGCQRRISSSDMQGSRANPCQLDNVLSIDASRRLSLLQGSPPCVPSDLRCSDRSSACLRLPLQNGGEDMEGAPLATRGQPATPQEGGCRSKKKRHGCFIKVPRQHFSADDTEQTCLIDATADSPARQVSACCAASSSTCLSAHALGLRSTQITKLP